MKGQSTAKPRLRTPSAAWRKRESEKSEQNETFYATERSYGSFTRSFTLPEGIDADKAHAELKNGVLSIAIPKRPEAQTRKINVASK